jgi:hypothetical protein
MMTQVEALAYIAGIIDGEGYIGVVRRKPKAMTNYKYTVRLSVAMTNKAPLEFIRKEFSLPKTKLRINSRERPLLRNHKACYVLDVENEAAVRICEAIEGFLMVKHKQAKLISRMRTYQNNTRNKRRAQTSRVRCEGNRSGSAPVRELTDDYLRTCELYYNKLKVLNKRGVL